MILLTNFVAHKTSTTTLPSGTICLLLDQLCERAFEGFLHCELARTDEVTAEVGSALTCIH